MPTSELSPSELFALFETLHPETIKLAVRLNELIAWLEKHRSYGEIRIDVKAGKCGYVWQGQGWREGDAITL